MIFSKQKLIRNILIITFSCQFIVSAFTYYYDYAGVVVNSINLSILVALVVVVGFRINWMSICIASVISFALLSNTYHLIVGHEANYVIIFKMAFIAASFLIGYQGASRYGWQLHEFYLIGVILLFTGILSMVVGELFNVVVTDVTYKEGIIGLTKHPAITAMLLAGSMPFLLAANHNSRYFLLVAYLCIFLTMRRTAILGCIPFIFAKYRMRYNYSPVLSIAVLLAVLFVVQFFIEVDTYVYFERLASLISGEDTAGSGRTIFWSLLLEQVYQFSIPDILFGVGGDAVSVYLLRHYGAAIGSHNDFIDLLFSYGLFSSFALLMFYCGSIILILSSRIISRPVEYYAALAITIYLFFVSVVSGGALDVQASPLYFAMGICMPYLVDVYD